MMKIKLPPWQMVVTVTVVLRNNTRDWLEIKKGIPIARMVVTNEVPKVTNILLRSLKSNLLSLRWRDRICS